MKLYYHIIAVLVVAVWGVTFINSKILLMNGFTPQDIFLVRFAMAYICIWTVSPKRLFADSLKDEFFMVLLGLTGGSMYFLAENMAVGITYVNNVSFIVCTAPLLTTLLGHVFVKGIRLTRWLVAGSVLSLVGVAFVVYNGSFVLHLNPLGDLLALTASLCWAVYSLLMKSVSARYGAVFITRKVFAYGLLTILPVFLVEPWSVDFRLFAKPVVWGNFVFLGLVASFVCFLLWSLVIKRLGALTATNYVYLNPVTTLIASAVFLNEPMNGIAYLGCGMILFGVYISNFK